MLSIIHRYSLELFGGICVIFTTILSHFDPVLSLTSLIGGIIGAVILPTAINIGAGVVGRVS